MMEHSKGSPAAPRVLGLLGGMSWESTAVYYRLINQGVAQRRGGLHSAPLVLHSVDFADMAALLAAGDWRELGRRLAAAAAGLRAAGAQALVLATNTMHKLADAIEDGSGLPLLHIADATGAALKAAGAQHASLLGTRFTMEDAAIVQGRLQQAHGLQISVPDRDDRALLQRVIFDELCRGIVSAESRQAVHGVMQRQAQRGAQVAILGCTELMLQDDGSATPLPTVDTTVLHAQAAVQWLCALDSKPAPEHRP